MATNPMGPTFDGGEEVVGVDTDGGRYHLLFLPDVQNDALQAEGKPAYFYWVPRAIRIARKGEDGDYKFRLLHFVGIQDEDRNVGVQGRRETAGGVLAVTTTSAPPVSVLESAKQELIKRLQGDKRQYWSLRTNRAPVFAPTPVSASTVTLTNLSPGPDGTVPLESPALPQNAPGAGGAGAPGGNGSSAGGPPAGPPGSRNELASSMRRTRGDLLESPPTLPLDPQMRYQRDVGGSVLDPWAWGLQGNGPGPIDPAAEHAFSGLLGTLPTAILWQGFRGAYSPVSVVQSFLIPVWSRNLKLTITGNWDRVFQHFSANTGGRYYWFSADIKAEFNRLRATQQITVDLLIDGTAPGADKLEQEIAKRIELIINTFTDLAKGVIFEPAPKVDPAKVSDNGGALSSFAPFGGGLALKASMSTTQMEINYSETRTFRYNRLHVVSSSLEGFFEDLKRDEHAERKYFDTLYLDNWDEKVTRIVKPVVNWPDPSQHWPGDPVAFLSCQIGYPDARGTLQWVPYVFQATDTGDTSKWTPAFSKKNAADVVNAPANWTPDKTFVKRMVHLTEARGALEQPNNRVFVERNVIALDPGENGTLSNDNTIEVRADSVGTLEVGPMSLDIALTDSTQVVEVEMQASGRMLDGTDRPVVRFTWTFADQDEPRRWKIFTGDPTFRTEFRYRVRVIVKGSLFSKGMEWTGPWKTGMGDGPFMVAVPTPDDEGVTRRALLDEGEVARPTTGVLRPPPRTTGEAPVIAPPPRTRTEVGGYDVLGRSEGMPASGGRPIRPPPRQAAGRMMADDNGSRADKLELVTGWRSGPSQS